MEKKETLRIDILGSSFNIQTDEDPEYLKDLINYLESKLEEIKRSVSTGDNLKLSILTSLLLCDELFKERKQKNPENEEVARITENLIQTIDKALQE